MNTLPESKKCPPEDIDHLVSLPRAVLNSYLVEVRHNSFALSLFYLKRSYLFHKSEISSIHQKLSLYS
jgi:hypothetical protein